MNRREFGAVVVGATIGAAVGASAPVVAVMAMQSRVPRWDEMTEAEQQAFVRLCKAAWENARLAP
jgi:hypothetical protein